MDYDDRNDDLSDVKVDDVGVLGGVEWGDVVVDEVVAASNRTTTSRTRVTT